MRLLLNYKGINKILPKVENYAGIVQFVHENFFLKMSKWTLSYIDSDGDSISLDSDLDVQTMLETITKDHLKVYIKDIDGEEGKQNAQEIDISSEIKSEKAEQVEVKIVEEEVQEKEPVIVEEKKEIMQEELKAEEN